MRHVIDNKLITSWLIFCAIILAGCSSYKTLIDKKEVESIPPDRYERIIRLRNPLGTPPKTLDGVVFVKEGARVCTDYPREETIKNLDDLEMMEKHAFRSFSFYAIEADGTIFGYVALPPENRALIYKNSKEEGCLYKVVIIEPTPSRGVDVPVPKTGGFR
jgi:hypothetical protein